jgi:uncharacterized membrane-anchored protein YjiN (DUF445 family)
MSIYVFGRAHMGKSQIQYKRLDPETAREITAFVIEFYKEEEARGIKVRNDRKRANIKLLLRKYREIVSHVEDAVYEASQLSDDYALQELLGQMSGDRRETFRIESIKESAARSRAMVDHINRMMECYRIMCESSGKDEERRRFRVVYDMYINPVPKTADQIAVCENVDKSTVYRDVDAAAERLAVLLFGIYGLKFL